MRKLQYSYFRFVIFFVLIGFSLDAKGVPLSPGIILTGHGGIETLIEGNSRFAFDLYKQIDNTQKNLVFSPYNISTTFAMLSPGAAGQTQTEMQDVLRYSIALSLFLKQLNEQLTTKHDSATSLSTANSIWLQNNFSITPTYQRTIERSFGPSINNVDFANKPAQAIDMINTWVSKATKGKIKNLVTPHEVSKETRMVLTSAIYFKAPWAKPFEPKETTRETFYPPTGGTIKTPMMKKTGNFKHYSDEHLAMIEIPYCECDSGVSLSMVIALPNDKDAWNDFINYLSYDNWISWMNALEMKHVNLSFPRFKITESLELNQPLQELGMVTAFTPQADFSAMTNVRNLFINSAVHKTFIDVDEKGTEAAAATAITMNLTAFLPTETFDFKADHPFVFFIIAENRTILFIGHVAQP